MTRLRSREDKNKEGRSKRGDSGDKNSIKQVVQYIGAQSLKMKSSKLNERANNYSKTAPSTDDSMTEISTCTLRQCYAVKCSTE